MTSRFELAEHERGLIVQADNLPLCARLAAESRRLSSTSTRRSIPGERRHALALLKTVRDAEGRPRRLSGRALSHRTHRRASYADSFDDYLAFLEPRIVEAHRVLKPTGSFYFHIDYREVHYCKLIDGVFGREAFINEIYLGLRLRSAHAKALARQYGCL